MAIVAAERRSLRRELGLPDLVLFNVVATLGIQSISVYAHVGPVAIPLHLTAALLFFVPSALVVASLSRRVPAEGGFYVWTRSAFGGTHAFLCGWCWWISVLLYLPGLLLIAAGMASAVIGGSDGILAQDARAQVGFTLLVLWFTVIANIFGLRVSKWLSNAAGLFIYIGGALVLIAGVIFWAREGAATRFTFDTTLDLGRASLWAQVAFGYTGLELGALLGGEVRDPERTIPRAAWISSAAVTGAYVLGSLSLMLVLPPQDINPMTGLAQVASEAGLRLGAGWLGTLAPILLFVGIVGKVATWSGGAARLPFVIGLDGAFPAVFTRVHPRWQTPWVALALQGAACSVFLVFTQAGETLRSGWQLLMDMEILLAFIPYVYFFLTAWKFHLRWSATSGLFVTLAAMGLALIPPEGAASIWLFEAKLIGGSALLLLFGWCIFYSRGRARGALGSHKFS